MKFVIYGIDNRIFYDVRRAEFADDLESAEEIKKEMEKIYPLVEIEKSDG